ncbi:uncharacterized protein [Aquarana catesbeiana]|uniref:uncharacterized protein isoform X1 n=1 Tax=Aquarana catesbeiana TaxID=8400 RepID=UPI003CC94330
MGPQPHLSCLACAAVFGAFHLPFLGFYDCRAAVIKKLKKRLRGEHITGKPVELREWEVKLKDGLGLLAEVVPGVSSRGPHQRAGDRETSSVERSTPSPSHRHSESPIRIPDSPEASTGRKQQTITPQESPNRIPPASSGRKQWPNTPQDQQDQPEGRAQCSPHSPVLILEGIELQNEPELRPAMSQTPAFSPWPEEEVRGQSSGMLLPPCTAAPSVHVLQSPPPVRVPTAPGLTAQIERLLSEVRRLTTENRRQSRDMRRLTRTIHLIGRQQMDHFELLLSRVNQQHNQAMEHLRLSLMEAISRHNAPLPGSSSVSTESSREPSPSEN